MICTLKDRRMAKIAEAVREGVTVFDIGSDHALIPVYLLKSGKCPRAVITDISRNSLEKGLKNVIKEGVSVQVEAVCTDGTLGLDLPDEADIIITGMGGELIAEIISRDERLKDKRYRLILQPMTKVRELRIYLSESGFSDIKEQRVLSCGKIYCVISCGYTGSKEKTGDKEAYFGYGFDRTHNEDRQYAKKTLNDLKRKMEGLKSSGKTDSEELNKTGKLISYLEKELDS